MSPPRPFPPPLPLVARVALARACASRARVRAVRVDAVAPAPSPRRSHRVARDARPIARAAAAMSTEARVARASRARRRRDARDARERATRVRGARACEARARRPRRRRAVPPPPRHDAARRRRRRRLLRRPRRARARARRRDRRRRGTRRGARCERAAVMIPKAGAHFKFDGRFLHGVFDEFASGDVDASAGFAPARRRDHAATVDVSAADVCDSRANVRGGWVPHQNWARRVRDAVLGVRFDGKRRAQVRRTKSLARRRRGSHRSCSKSRSCDRVCPTHFPSPSATPCGRRVRGQGALFENFGRGRTIERGSLRRPPLLRSLVACVATLRDSATRERRRWTAGAP